MKKEAIQHQLLIDLILKYVEDLNLQLETYSRKTGVMRTKGVARNYIRYSEWLKILKKDGNFIHINDHTIYLSSICCNKNFNLTNKEKMSLFRIIIEKEQFKNMLGKLMPVCSPKNFITQTLTEHLVETFLEWCFDLGILKSTSKKFGKFILNQPYVELIELAKNNGSNDELLKKYFSITLNKNILYFNNMAENLIWNQALMSLNRTAEFTATGIDPNLYSALPMILDLQIELVLKYNRYAPLFSLISTIEKISKKQGALFSWDYLKNGGYIQLGV